VGAEVGVAPPSCRPPERAYAPHDADKLSLDELMARLHDHGNIRAREHLDPGSAPGLSQRLQAPAAHHAPSLNQLAERGGSGQSAIITGFLLSAILRKLLPPKPLPRQIPIDGRALTALPRVRSSEAF